MSSSPAVCARSFRKMTSATMHLCAMGPSGRGARLAPRQVAVAANQASAMAYMVSSSTEPPSGTPLAAPNV